MSRTSKAIIDTPIGKILATATRKALLTLDFVDSETAPLEYTSNDVLISLETQLKEYFGGGRKVFDIPIMPVGTPFQLLVWQTLQGIEYSKTISYSDEAKNVSNPKAHRAVAKANGANPIIIIIPCHRVISKDGSIGRYSCGVWRKEFLLALEEKYR
jgi:methylated-DNA-[protein]-cysteine S-methyltransferase